MMRISIKEDGKKFVIPLPTSLIFSSFNIWILKRNKSGIKDVDFSKLSPKAMRKIRRTIRQMRKIHKNLYFVEVEDGNTTVKIKL